MKHSASFEHDLWEVRQAIRHAALGGIDQDWMEALDTGSAEDDRMAIEGDMEVVVDELGEGFRRAAHRFERETVAAG